MRTSNILVFNCGSSSIKCMLYTLNTQQNYLFQWKAQLGWKEGFRDAEFHFSERQQSNQQEKCQISSEKEAFEKIFKVLAKKNSVDLIGHRVVHGGKDLRSTVLIDKRIKASIQKATLLAPLHNRASLLGIEMAGSFYKKVPQFAVFDSAFHATLPEEAATYPGPYEWLDMGIRRYGFHGISFQYCAPRAAHFLERDLKNLKMLICHLGAGASLCAIKGGVSVDTTMGFTPMEGLMMASRSGSIDPGILIYLMREQKMSAGEIEKQLNFHSGLLGISGSSEDLRDILLEADKGKKRSQLALGIYLHRLRGFMGQMIATLEGLDVLVFTGGVGEHLSRIRAEAVRPFGFLKFQLDDEKNNATSEEERLISSPDSRIPILVIPTQEELEIARESVKTYQESYLLPSSLRGI